MIRNEVQKLEPGSLVTLIEVDCTSFGGDTLYFHGHNISLTERQIDALINPLYAGSLRWFAGTQEKYAGQGGATVDGFSTGATPIIWQGITYNAWPCQVEGIEADSSGQPTNPTLSVGNVDGTISSLCLFFDDLVQAKVVIRQTLSKYLDAANFVGGNPDADPNEEFVETWYIDSKQQEDNESITWQLSNPADVSGQLIPARIITGMCEWCMRGEYRGPDCNYTGPMFDENDQPTTDPERDICAGVLQSCKVRFGADNPLPYGGFPASNLLGK